MKAGSRLRALRSRLGVTTREVAEQSHQIATAEGNPEFYISNAWLTKLENTGFRSQHSQAHHPERRVPS